LSWHTVKELDKIYMKEQLIKAGTPAPEAIGVDEVSVRKGHDYRIVVSDLKRRRAIWFGGKDRSQKSMDLFYAELGVKKCSKINLVVMDMWTAFKQAAKTNIPQAAIMYDKFHVMKSLNEKLNTVRKQEYHRLTNKNRDFIKGQKYTLLSRQKNLSTKGKRSLKLLLDANARLNKAYILKESFTQLWSYKSETWARKFFERWRESLKWQRLKPYEDFAKMIESHWEGISTYCNSEDKVPLGFVEGLNNKIKMFQRRAYGFKDEDYLRLKILTDSLKEL